jgi:hypothetical protein
MIAKDSIILLQHFFDIELEKFIHGKVVGGLSKHSRITECQDNIINFMEFHSNSIFIIENISKKDNLSTMSLKIYNIEEKNDHSKIYTISISESCETFQVKRHLEYNGSEYKENTQIVIEFEKSKL